MSNRETVTRSLVKTLSWRVVILITDFSIAYLLTGSVDIASKLAVIKLVLASIFYFLHERGWNLVSWGRA